MSYDLTVRCISAGRFEDAEYGSFDVLDGRITVSDEATADALVDRHKRIERPGTDADADVDANVDVDNGNGGEADDADDEADSETCGAQLNSGGTCDRPADSCPYHDASDR
jgi:hypothetical protein